MKLRHATISTRPTPPPTRKPGIIPLNLRIPKDITSFAATQDWVTIKMTHDQANELIDNIIRQQRLRNPIKWPEAPEQRAQTRADTDGDYQVTIAGLQVITDSNSKCGGTQEYWDSPQGQSFKRDAATLIRALKILRAGGCGCIGRLASPQPLSQSTKQ